MSDQWLGPKPPISWSTSNSTIQCWDALGTPTPCQRNGSRTSLAEASRAFRDAPWHPHGTPMVHPWYPSNRSGLDGKTLDADVQGVHLDLSVWLEFLSIQYVGHGDKIFHVIYIYIITNIYGIIWIYGGFWKIPKSRWASTLKWYHFGLFGGIPILETSICDNPVSLGVIYFQTNSIFCSFYFIIWLQSTQQKIGLRVQWRNWALCSWSCFLPGVWFEGETWWNTFIKNSDQVILEKLRISFESPNRCIQYRPVFNNFTPLHTHWVCYGLLQLTFGNTFFTQDRPISCFVYIYIYQCVTEGRMCFFYVCQLSLSCPK